MHVRVFVRILRAQRRKGAHLTELLKDNVGLQNLQCT